MGYKDPLEKFIPKTNADWARRQIAKHGRDRYPTVNTQFRKLVEEIGELSKELNKEDEAPGARFSKLQAECADVALALYNLCDKLQIDLDAAIRTKVQKDDRKFDAPLSVRSTQTSTENSSRMWRRYDC